MNKQVEIICAADVVIRDVRREGLDIGRWGAWRLNRRSLELTIDRDGFQYEIDLERITTSAQMLDWIYQLRGKMWMRSVDIADLVAAFDDIFNPQANLCSQGRPKTIADVRQFLRQRLAAQ